MFSPEEKEKLVVGYKQTLRAIKANTAKRVLLAEDCDSEMFNEIKGSFPNAQTVPTMKELGRECGIDTAASCAAITG